MSHGEGIEVGETDGLGGPVPVIVCGNVVGTLDTGDDEGPEVLALAANSFLANISRGSLSLNRNAKNTEARRNQKPQQHPKKSWTLRRLVKSSFSLSDSFVAKIESPSRYCAPDSSSS